MADISPQPKEQPSRRGKPAAKKRPVARRGSRKPPPASTGAKESGPSASSPAVVTPVVTPVVTSVASTSAGRQKRAAEEDAEDPRPQKRAAEEDATDPPPQKRAQIERPQTEGDQSQPQAAATQEDGADGSAIPVGNEDMEWMRQFVDLDKLFADFAIPDSAGTAEDSRRPEEGPLETQGVAEAPTTLEEEVAQRHAMGSTSDYFDWGIRGNSRLSLEDFLNNVVAGMVNDTGVNMRQIIKWVYLDDDLNGGIEKLRAMYPQEWWNVFKHF